MSDDGQIKLVHPKLLLGEGVDERRLFASLVKHIGLQAQVQVLAYSGKDNLRAYLSTLRKLPHLNNVVSIGITRDADGDAGGALQSIESAILHANFPAEIGSRVLVLPGNGRPGALEDILIPALSSDPVWPCIENLVTCRAGALGPWTNQLANVGKAKVEAWLNTRNHPTIRLGEAAEKGLLPFAALAFAPLITFLKSL